MYVYLRMPYLKDVNGEHIHLKWCTGNECKVGFYDPNGDFYAESFHDTADEAAQRVSYLNGGNPPPKEND